MNVFKPRSQYRKQFGVDCDSDGRFKSHYVEWLERKLRAALKCGAQKPTTNSAMVPCPTCGAACTIYSSGEGTNSFEPVTPYRAQHQ